MGHMKVVVIAKVDGGIRILDSGKPIPETTEILIDHKPNDPNHMPVMWKSGEDISEYDGQFQIYCSYDFCRIRKVKGSKKYFLQHDFVMSQDIMATWKHDKENDRYVFVADVGGWWPDGYNLYTHAE